MGTCLFPANGSCVFLADVVFDFFPQKICFKTLNQVCETVLLFFPWCVCIIAFAWMRCFVVLLV